jgi:hypothetical protein
MLILLIGCAINGDSKELFIENIQLNIDTQIQIELVPYIELVTEDMNFSISKNLKLALEQQQQQQSPDTSISSSTSSFIQTCQQLIQNHQNNSSNQSNDILINKLLINIQRVIDERDLFSESIIELQQDKDFLIQQLNQNGFKIKLNNKKCVSDVNNDETTNHHHHHHHHDNNNINCINVDDLNNQNNSNDVNSQLNDGKQQQKLSLELVEYKVKMRQLRMEM